jgi:hypothetical protein
MLSNYGKARCGRRWGISNIVAVQRRRVGAIRKSRIARVGRRDVGALSSMVKECAYMIVFAVVHGSEHR